MPTLQGIVGGLITPVYDGLDSKHHAYVNDEGLLNNPQHFFMLKDGHQPLAGNGVILSTTRNGDEAPCTLPLDWVKERVTFMDRKAVLEWIGKEADQASRESAENIDIKAAKKEAWAQHGAETEQAIAEGQEHGRGRSRE